MTRCCSGGISWARRFARGPSRLKRACAFPTCGGGRASVSAPISPPGIAIRTRPALQSFNPLFPGNSYSGAVGLLGPTNLTDLTPAVTMSPRRGLVVGFEAPSYWRTSEADGIYATDLRVLVPPAGGYGQVCGDEPRHPRRLARDAAPRGAGRHHAISLRRVPRAHVRRRRLRLLLGDHSLQVLTRADSADHIRRRLQCGLRFSHARVELLPARVEVMEFRLERLDACQRRCNRRPGLLVELRRGDA